MTAAIRIDGLQIQRGAKLVIPGLDVEVPAGRITGLLGPSGSGKSTLLRAIVGVQEVLGGTVTVLGQEAGSPALRRQVAYMTQAPSVYADLSAGENLRFFASMLSVGAPEIERALEIVGLEGEHDRLVDEMSGGQRTRVSLATTLWRARSSWCSTSRRSASTRCSATTSGGPSASSSTAARHC